jgi:hypothetical protein
MANGNGNSNGSNGSNGNGLGFGPLPLPLRPPSKIAREDEAADEIADEESLDSLDGLDDGLEGALGVAAPEFVGEEDPSASAPPPTPVAELAAAAVRFVTGKYGVPLDFSSDTLSLLDQYVRDSRAEVLLLPSSMDLIAAALGAYWGEVVRRSFGGYWEASGDHSTYRLCFSRVFLSLNPLGVGREALTMQAEEGWGAHFEVDPKERSVVFERLSSWPEADEAEYYLPSTRFDATEVAFEVLRARMIARGDAGVRFIPRDYGIR